jgi:hypothetical protein
MNARLECPNRQNLEEALIAESAKWLRIVREMMEDGKEKLKREQVRAAHPVDGRPSSGEGEGGSGEEN